MSDGHDRLRIALCQLNPTVGDLPGNEALIADALRAGAAAGAQLVLAPELVVTGYPPEDLLLRERFLADARGSLERLATVVPEVVAFVGFPERAADDVYNSLAVLEGGAVRAVYRKIYLPNYGVFDENRYFQAGDGPAMVRVGDHLVGLTVCEDCWEPGPPVSDEALAGATLIVNPSASPYHQGKGAERERMFAQRARDNLAAVAFCALVGGQDELVFDGQSLVVDHEGVVLARAAQFTEEILIADVEPGVAAAARLHDAGHRPAARRARAAVPVLAELAAPARGSKRGEPPADAPPVREGVADALDPEAEVYAALCLGLRDYVEKNGFEHVTLGLSGGIDSTLVALIAVDALGPERVSVAVMPSPYSSAATQDDARELAGNLGIECLDLSIEPGMKAFDEMLAAPFAGREPDLTEENIQARVRGTLLMALSNKLGWLVLTTGNKSESSVGYSTLYGDTAGGLAVIKDCPKTLVYRLVEHRERRSPARVVPETIISRPPSAELRPDQKDEDSLPPYAVLDPLLEAYVEHDLDAEGLVARGFDRETVEKVIAMVDRAEYKRRQAPPGIKVTRRAFGRDRRLPITNRYRG